MDQLGSPTSSLDDISDQYHSQSLEGRITTENDKDRPLGHLTVYVEMFSNGTNISDASYRYLETLGATVEKRLNRKCNLVIWKDGPLKTVERARSYAIPVVNSRWLEACLEEHVCADFNKYLPNLPDTKDLPFASTHSKKKRKATDSSEENFTFESLSSSKPALKKKKKNDTPEISSIEKRITIKLNTIKRSLNDDDDDDKKFMRRSQTMGAPSLGSWLVKSSDKKSFLENEENDENESEDSRSISRKDPESSMISQVDSERIKKEKEEESAKVRSLISKYTSTRASSLGAIETTTRKPWLDRKDEEKTEKKPSALQERPGRKFSRSSSESSDKGKRGKSSPLVLKKAQSSSDEGEEYDPLRTSNASASSFSLKTRLSLREEDLAYKERREKEKEEEEKARKSKLSEGKKVGNTSDIGAIARIEMKKIERSDIGKISSLYSKYTGKSLSASASLTKSMEEEPEEKKSARGVSKGRVMEEEVEEEKKERRKSLRHRMDEEEEESDKEEAAPVKTRGRAAPAKEEKPKETKTKPVAEVKRKESIDSASASKGKKLETPAKAAERSSAQTSVTKTPTTTGNQSLIKSSFLSKYLDSASSDASPEVKKSARKNPSPPPQRDTKGVINLKSKFSEEEDEEEVLQKTTIKKKTNQKEEKTVFFTGFSRENSEKAKEFCEKFGLKFLEDEVRNLSRAETLVYEGKEIPHNLRTAYTMVRNKPIVSKAWFDECLKQGKVVDNKKYQKSYDAKIRQGLFKDMRFNIDKEYEGLKGNMVTKGDLVGLIEASGGKVFENVRSCDLYLSRVSKPTIEIPPHVKVITLQWVIDSIIEGKRQSTDKVNFGTIEFCETENSSVSIKSRG